MKDRSRFVYPFEIRYEDRFEDQFFGTPDECRILVDRTVTVRVDGEDVDLRDLVAAWAERR